MIVADSILKSEIKNLFPDQDIDPKQIQPASVDLRLGNTFRYQPEGVNDHLRVQDLSKPDDAWRQHYGPLELHPGHQHFVLGHTMETVHVPFRYAARVEGRSSLGRRGLRVHSTAGFIDPGFKGQITLEIDCVGRRPLLLQPGLRICQICFYRVDGIVHRPYGHPGLKSKYQNQTGATASRSDLDE